MRSADYVQETTTSIAGSSGNGAVTLTQITSVPRFSTVFGTSARAVRYVIEDTISKKMETGIGSVASNELTRTKPQVTWDGTTWNDQAPTAIQFGATPTSGDVVVRLAPTAEANGVTMHAIQSSITTDSNWRDYKVSGHLGLHGTSGTPILTASREYYQCYRLDFAGLLSGMKFEVTTLVAASSMSVALYEMGTNGLPGGKIVGFNNQSTASTGFKTDTTTGTWAPAGKIWLTPGWYVIGFIASHSIGVRSSNLGSTQSVQPTPYGKGSNSYGFADTVYAAGSGTTMPTSPAPTTALAPDAAGSRVWIGLSVIP
jgi:hypothetical protein